MLILTLLIAARAVAQEHLPNEMPSAMRVKSSSVAGHTPAPAPEASLPNPPTPQKVRVIDKKFFAVMAGLGGAESFASRPASWCWITNSPRALPG